MIQNLRKTLSITALSAVLLAGCTAKTSIVKPVSEDGILYTAFNESAQELYEDLENNDDALEEMPSAFSKIGTSLPDIELTTYNGDTINLKDYNGKKVVLELVGYWCTYCQKESAKYLNDLVKDNDDVVFIQAFLEGAKEDVIEDEDGNKVTKDTIKTFYEDAGIDMNDDIIVTQENDDIYKYAFDTIGITYYPAFLMFDENGKLAYYHEQFITGTELQTIFDKVYGDKKFVFYDNFADGVSDLSAYVRSWEDVKNDYSDEQKEALDNLGLDDSYGEQAFYMNVGQTIDVDAKLVDINDEIIDLTKSTGTTIYTVFTEDDVNLEDKIEVYNKYQKVADNDITFVALFINSSSGDAKAMYDSLTIKPNGYVLDVKNDTPEALYNVMLYASSQTIYVNEEKKLCTGSYLGTYSLEALQKAYNFMTSESSYMVEV